MSTLTGTDRTARAPPYVYRTYVRVVQAATTCPGKPVASTSSNEEGGMEN
jgi:hypothetical protein